MPFEPPRSEPEPPPWWEKPPAERPRPRRQIQPRQVVRAAEKIVSLALTLWFVDISTGGALHRAAQRELMRAQNRFRRLERQPSPAEISALHAEARAITEGSATP